MVNTGDFARQDVKVKRENYVTTNVELNKEFYFSRPDTKFNINQIYNSHYTGSPLWNLFSPEVMQLEGSYNKSIKLMFDVPFDTHRNLIEPISGTTQSKLFYRKDSCHSLSKSRSPKRGCLSVQPNQR